ncbi:MAG: zf-HC2 domain-containing protein [Lachnospiraceae bacterium]|nr:zf-HC2 domain-containing protein [Lachnospiraceae bacterium]
MNCNEMDKYIPLFIEDELTGDELGHFLNHIDSCKVCYDEMETSYLIKESLIRLEEGDSFDLHSELLEKIKTMKRCYFFHESIALVRRVLLILAGFSVVSLIVYLYIIAA